jgi:translation initiation factor IF-3
MVNPFDAKVNGQINASEVRVITEEDTDLGVHPLAEALDMARARSIDLVEIRPDDTPPICRLIDYGRFQWQIRHKTDGSPS